MIPRRRRELRSKLMEKGAAVIYVALVIVALVVGALIGNRWTSAEAAGWVQAGGSLLALAIAIGIAYFQHRSTELKARADEDALARKVLVSISDELTVRWQQYTEVVGSEVAKAEKQGYMSGFWLLPDYPFPVFEGLRSHLPLIQSADLRREIIRTYALFEGLVLTINTNSDMARQYHHASASEAVYGGYASAAVTKLAETVLVNYYKSVVTSEDTARKAVEKLLESIRQELARTVDAHDR